MTRKEMTEKGIHNFESRPTALLEPNQYLVVVWFDGEADLWVCDSEEAIAALEKNYEEEWGASRIRVQIFKEVSRV